eukprot:747603-Hanusia_phi.AAC.2
MTTFCGADQEREHARGEQWRTSWDRSLIFSSISFMLCSAASRFLTCPQVSLPCHIKGGGRRGGGGGGEGGGAEEEGYSADGVEVVEAQRISLKHLVVRLPLVLELVDELQPTFFRQERQAVRSRSGLGRPRREHDGGREHVVCFYLLLLRLPLLQLLLLVLLLLAQPRYSPQALETVGRTQVLSLPSRHAGRSEEKKFSP